MEIACLWATDNYYDIDICHVYFAMVLDGKIDKFFG